jgi:hypothetical protein
MGHFGPTQVKMAIQTLQMVNMELERQKMQGCVNTEAFLDCLNKYVPCTLSPSTSFSQRPLTQLRSAVGLGLRPVDKS